MREKESILRIHFEPLSPSPAKCERGLRVKMAASKPEDLSLNPRSHMADGEDHRVPDYRLERLLRVWRTRRSYRGSEFGSKHPQPSIISVPGEAMDSYLYRYKECT